MIGTKKQAINWLLNYDDDKKFEIKEYHEKRGLRANAYYWKLLNELANVLKVSKEDLHLRMLDDYSQHEFISVEAPIDVSKYIKYYQEAGEAELNGKLFKHYKVYKPSSDMDSKEFSILLDGLVQECKQQDIPTLDDEELEGMIKEYEKVFNSKQSR